MESYENHENCEQREAVNTSPENPAPYAQEPRRGSPFDDSPYVMNGADGSNQYQPPRAPEDRSGQKKKGRAWKAVAACVSVIAIAAGSCAVTAQVLGSRWERENRKMQQEFENRIGELQAQVEVAERTFERTAGGVSVSGTASADGLTPAQVYARNVRSVVLIQSKVHASGFTGSSMAVSSGSGFILTEDGYILTNSHVVEGAASVSVTTHDGDVYDAKVLGSDSVNDVALLKVEAEGLQAVTVGSSDDLIVGDQVVAIGNPLGALTSTLTVGYVSAKDRDIATDGSIINMIQTDAAINSGNSGGPLFNMRGEVIGITTAKYSGASSTGASIEGIGFAIPVDDVMPLINDLRDYGYVTGAYLGVVVSDMDAQTASIYNLPVGAYVREVTPGYCAEAAGLQPKDIIIALGEHEVSGITGLTRALRHFKAGDSTTITVIRSGQKLSLPITLDEKPANLNQPSEELPEGNMPESGSFDEWYDYFAPFFGGGKDKG